MSEMIFLHLCHKLQLIFASKLKVCSSFDAGKDTVVHASDTLLLLELEEEG